MTEIRLRGLGAARNRLRRLRPLPQPADRRRQTNGNPPPQRQAQPETRRFRAAVLLFRIYRERTRRTVFLSRRLAHPLVLSALAGHRAVRACLLPCRADRRPSPTEQTDCPALCSVLLTALSALEKKKRDPALVKAALEWRVMAEGGYAPDLAECSVCGEPLVRPPSSFRSRPAARQTKNAPAESAALPPSITVPPPALRHALTIDPRRLFAFTLTGPAKEQFTTLAERFAAYHLGRGFASLKLYESLKIEPKKSSKKGAECRVEREDAAVPICARINR